MSSRAHLQTQPRVYELSDLWVWVTRRGLPVGVRVIAALAGAKALLGLALFLFDWRALFDVASRPIPPAVYLAQVVVFGAAAVWLWTGGQDARTSHLAGFFAIVASSFSARAIREFVPTISAAHPTLAWVLSGTEAMQAEVFLPVMLWLFVRDFPHAPSFDRPARLPDALAAASFAIGLFLFVVNLAIAVAPQQAIASWLAAFQRDSRNPPLYWLLVFGLALPALPFVAWKARRARIEERRRVGLLVAGLLLGFGPIVVEVLLEGLIPAFHARMATRAGRQVGGLILYPLLLSIPLTTAYAVVVDRVLDVRFVMRKAAQYALAKYSLLGAVAVPFVGFAWMAYQRRRESLTTLLSGDDAALALVWVVAGSVLLMVRSRLAEALDRRFFREQFDAHQILSSVAHEASTVATAIGLAELVTRQLDRALHLHAAVLLVSTGDELVDPLGTTSALPQSSSLVARLRTSGRPVPVDVDSGDAPADNLDERDRQWLAARGIELLVPITARSGGLAGVIGLGGKRSELPFSTDDRELLAAVASSAALAVEGMRLRGGAHPPPRGPMDEPARECPRCGLVMSSEVMICPECRVPSAEASVPYVLFGKFQFLRQLGAGGMGVVYLATDLALNRRVAVKTLPHMLPRYAMRLQREARAMAAFLHPNLALIFGAESWRGLPLLVEEYLSGGTLSDRLRRRRLSVDEALALGATLAGALERLHSGGVLHRDIKPSNIAFAADGTPKLLDFGLASIASERLPKTDDDTDTTTAETIAVRVGSADGTRSGVVLGTPGYLSPEALERRPADPRVDVWSLTIVLFEAISGINPFHGRTVAETLDRILHTDVPDIRDYAPECPPAVADFFRVALSRNRRRRPPGARELRWQMENLQRAPVPLSA